MHLVHKSLNLSHFMAYQKVQNKNIFEQNVKALTQEISNCIVFEK
jgi:hypothetical protein